MTFCMCNEKLRFTLWPVSVINHGARRSSVAICITFCRAVWLTDNITEFCYGFYFSTLTNAIVTTVNVYAFLIIIIIIIITSYAPMSSKIKLSGAIKPRG